MKDCFLLRENKIVNQSPVPCYSLRSNSRRTRQDVIGPQLWHIALKLPVQGEAACGAEHLPESRAPVPPRHAIQSRPPQHLNELGRAECRGMVAFPCKSQNRIWAKPHITIGPDREMNAEERKCGIWHRIDQASNQWPPGRTQAPIITPKRHD